MTPRYISAIWNNKRLTWWWSGKRWFCWKPAPYGGSVWEEGEGKTYDEAFLDWKQQVEGN